MKVRNHETTKFHIKKIVIEDNDFLQGYKVSMVINNKYIEYVHKGKYIDSILKEVKDYLSLMVDEFEMEEYIKI